MTKTRIQINVALETNANLNKIVGTELERDRKSGRPERSRNQVLEYVVNLGVRTWQQEAHDSRISQNDAK